MSNYGNATDARAFWEARAYTIPDSWLDADITKALLVVSEWIDGTYGARFNGNKLGERSQVREWPRYGATDVLGYPFQNDEFPRELLNAVYLACFRQMTTPGLFTTDYTPNKYRRASVDGAVFVEYANTNFAYELQMQSPIIDQAIAPILSAIGGGSMYSSFGQRA